MKTGFTLIELLVVVLIIGILAVIAVPQYQKAVLKSRFSSLMPTTKAVRDGNEAYFMTHGRYATAANQLDVTATNNQNMTLELSNDRDYSYVLATRPDLSEKNNLIMYQKHSTQFSGEIHCEAKDGDSQANWLCEKGMHSVKSLGEVITEGFNTYVIEGTGNGLTPSQMDAAQDAPTCDTAYAAGATNCHITEATENSPKTKEVCYEVSTVGPAPSYSYCVYTTFDDTNNKTKRIACNKYSCEEYEYDSEGRKIKSGHCDNERISADKKSCSSYYEIYEYEYGENTSKEKYCHGSNISGNSCSSYESIITYEYGEGNKKSKGWLCQYDNVSGNSCSSYDIIAEYEYNGNKSKEKYCGDSQITNEGACSSYAQIIESEYSEGKLSKQRTCGFFEIEGDSCSASTGFTTYEYQDGNQIESYCYEEDDCEPSYMRHYTYDEEGNKIYHDGYTWDGHQWHLAEGNPEYEG